MDLKDLSSNWKKLQATLKNDNPSTISKRRTDNFVQQDNVKRRKRSSSSIPRVHTNTTIEKRRAVLKKRNMMDTATETVDGVSKLSVQEQAKDGNEGIQEGELAIGRERVNEGLSSSTEVGKYIAIDCEMVGVGPNPDRDSALARVSIVNFKGDQVYDSFVKPKEMVTDWRTKVSGITPAKLVSARTLEEVQKDVAGLLDGRILIGHAIQNDLNALLLSHPKRDIRDTSVHPPYRKIAGGVKPRLKVLAAELLGLQIQGAAHSSVEDARATMLLFQRDKESFEREHSKRWPTRVQATDEKGDSATKKIMKQWELNYGWEKRLGRKLAPLRATITTKKGAEIEKALVKEDSDWDGEMFLGSEKTKVCVYGGVIVKPIETSPEGLVITFLSHGEDCFDALKDYADQIYDAVAGIDKDADIEWAEMPYCLQGEA
ncbi:3'-5' exonuclease [Ophidiomyces ophidiicola]|nr:3'-5' exonuclease [Ophidiomyces ophidiicola]KAI1926683.1 3'-5' exonuclease [Ophidiomyces ophidiicola]KAI1968047.1 3'-5' exonuclease [Ophidiomyces ophidiicola]KAI1975650.1 3'-5' exonuclease [Ophidiomyces ophidiicola]KAI2005710.1 3'-5' exonuclease [Ophidiomyces ophidiicola]